MKAREMTSKERILSALQGKSTDRIPFSPFLAYIWESLPGKIQKAGQLAFLKSVGADPLWRGAICYSKAIARGVVTKEKKKGKLIHYTVETPVGTIEYTYTTMTSGNGITRFLLEHPLKSEEDYKIQLWIEEHTDYEYDSVPAEQHFSGNGREGLTLGMLTNRSKTAFQSLVEFLAGTEELTYALCDYPETVRALMHTMEENNLKSAAFAAQSELEYFITWEDSSTQNYSPEMYDMFIAPEITRYCSLLKNNRKKYIQHACGHVKGLLASIKNSGVDAVESLSPPQTGNIDLADARKILGKSCGIIGGIEPVHLFSLSLEELGPYVEQVIEDGSGGPFVLANSDSCPPGVSIAKFKLISEIAGQKKNK